MLRSAASSACSDATAKEGHVNYDVSLLPVQARAAPTTGSGCYGWVMACAQYGAKNSLFFWWERAKAEVQYTPRRRNHRCRACREGSYDWGGSLVGADDSLFPCGGDTTCHNDGNCIIMAWEKCLWGQFLEVKPTWGVDFGNVVVRTSHANMPLRC